MYSGLRSYVYLGICTVTRDLKEIKFQPHFVWILNMVPRQRTPSRHGARKPPRLSQNRMFLFGHTLVLKCDIGSMAFTFTSTTDKYKSVPPPKYVLTQVFVAMKRLFLFSPHTRAMLHTLRARSDISIPKAYPWNTHIYD